MKIKALLLASAVALGASSFASAQEVTTSINFGIASDYIFRGVSQTLNTHQYFGGFDASAGKFYVGAWASNVDFGTKANSEVDLYAGFKPSLGPVTFDLGALIYMYPQENNFNTVEYKAAATYGLPMDMSLTGSLYYSPEVGKGGPDSLYKEVSLAAPLGDAKAGPFSLGLTGTYGSMATSTGDWDNWKLALAATSESGWAIEGGYTDTNVGTGHFITQKYADGRGYISLKKTF